MLNRSGTPASPCSPAKPRPILIMPTTPSPSRGSVMPSHRSTGRRSRQACSVARTSPCSRAASRTGDSTPRKAAPAPTPPSVAFSPAAALRSRPAAAPTTCRAAARPGSASPMRGRSSRRSICGPASASSPAGSSPGRSASACRRRSRSHTSMAPSTTSSGPVARRSPAFASVTTTGGCSSTIRSRRRPSRGTCKAASRPFAPPARAARRCCSRPIPRWAICCGNTWHIESYVPRYLPVRGELVMRETLDSFAPAESRSFLMILNAVEDLLRSARAGSPDEARAPDGARPSDDPSVAIRRLGEGWRTRRAAFEPSPGGIGDLERGLLAGFERRLDPAQRRLDDRLTRVAEMRAGRSANRGVFHGDRRTCLRRVDRSAGTPARRAPARARACAAADRGVGAPRRNPCHRVDA